VLLGNGNGTFQTAVNYATNSLPTVSLQENSRRWPIGLASANYGTNDASVLLVWPLH
jgi:hypothetical protein